MVCTHTIPISNHFFEQLKKCLNCFSSVQDMPKKKGEPKNPTPGAPHLPDNDTIMKDALLDAPMLQTSSSEGSSLLNELNNMPMMPQGSPTENLVAMMS